MIPDLGEDESEMRASEMEGSVDKVEKTRTIVSSSCKAVIPDPFPFPEMYPPRIQQAVSSGEIYGNDRLAFIRHIADFMVGFNPYPTPQEYERTAKAIVDKYPCMADTIAGQPVWVGNVH